MHNTNIWICWGGVAVDIKLGALSRFINMDLELTTQSGETDLCFQCKTDYLIIYTVLASFSSLSCFFFHSECIFWGHLSSNLLVLESFSQSLLLRKPKPRQKLIKRKIEGEEERAINLFLGAWL